jgi:hypothetical protein
MLLGVPGEITKLNDNMEGIKAFLADAERRRLTDHWPYPSDCQNTGRPQLTTMRNSSPKRELELCPKFTTKDSHTSLPRSRSHNGPTNSRNKPQTISKRKHDSRSKGLRCPANHQVDCLRPPGGPSAWVRRTVRKTSPNLQYCTLNLWTIRPTTDRPTL